MADPLYIPPEWTDQSIRLRPPRTKLIFIRCTPAEHAQLTALARRANRTMSNLIRLAVLSYATSIKTKKEN
jgi:hypothetical protein